MTVEFHDGAVYRLLKFAEVISQADGKRVFCKHRERGTYEIPGGHREICEEIFGMIYYTDITAFEIGLNREIESIGLLDAAFAVDIFPDSAAHDK